MHFSEPAYPAGQFNPALISAEVFETQVVLCTWQTVAVQAATLFAPQNVSK
jgi:hypothetical protein